MTSRYRFVMKFYPPEYRRVHGPEIVETAVELSPRGWSLKESVALAVGGLRTRALQASRGKQRNVWGQAVITAFGLWQVSWVTMLLADLVGIRTDLAVQYAIDQRFLIGTGVLLLVALSQRWWPPIPVLLVIQAIYPTLLGINSGIGAGFSSILTAALIIAGLWWATHRTDATRAFGPITVAVLIAGGLASAWFTGDPIRPWEVVAIVAVVVAVGLVRIDPRPLATAAAVVGCIMARTFPWAITSLVTDPQWTIAFFGIYVAIAAALAVAAQHGIGRLHQHTTPSSG